MAARALADELEAEAHRDTSLTHPEELVAANAARAAAQAAKLSWLAGRARDQENTRAIELASEAVHTALRMTRLDLVALAEQAVPRTPRLTSSTARPRCPSRDAQSYTQSAADVAQG